MVLGEVQNHKNNKFSLFSQKTIKFRIAGQSTIETISISKQEKRLNYLDNAFHTASKACNPE
jgi:hypothetical protein